METKRRKFAVGDIVIGTPESNKRYSYTNSSCLCKVVGCWDHGIICVRIVNHLGAYKSMIGSEFNVEEKYFTNPYKVELQ